MEHTRRECICDDFDTSKCCGCGSCIQSCPKNALFYGKDKYGFIIPLVDRSKCIKCGKCFLACPYESNNICYNEPIHTYAAQSNSNEVILKSTSGGIFRPLAEYVIDHCGVVYGAIMTDHYEVKHVRVSSPQDLDRVCKSKYVQSDLKNIFPAIRDDLLHEIPVLFSGTPCQVSALYAFLGRTSTDNLITVDIVCHGVPSQDLFSDYISYLERRKPLEWFVFRPKIKADNGMNSYVGYKYLGKNKAKIRNWVEDSYYGYFMYGYTCRDSCDGCYFAKEQRASDITLCDYWHWELFHSDFFRKEASVSGVIINSEKGQNFFDNIKQNLVWCESDYTNLSRNNESISVGSKANILRSYVLDMWKKNNYQAIDSFYRKKNCRFIIKSKILMNIPKPARRLLQKTKRKEK